MTVFLRKNTRFHKKGEIHELFVLALSLVWLAGATPESSVERDVSVLHCTAEVRSMVNQPLQLTLIEGNICDAEMGCRRV